jgi:polysaccharide chain length determinant protein (PEP-CTERM system associated)
MLGHRPLTLDDSISILKRRWWMFAVPAVVMPLAALGITLIVTPRYLSQTLVLVEQPTVPDDYVKSVVSEDLSGRLASMQEQILSRSRLEPIIERYHLYASAKNVMDDRIVLARKNITIKPIQSNIQSTRGLPGFFVSFQADDPHIAQLVCGEITSLFVSQNLHSREQSAQDTTDFLKEQLDAAKRSLDTQDAKLAAFQQQHFGKLPGEEASNVNMLTSLNMQLDAATQSLAGMEQDKSYSEMLLAQQGGGVGMPATQNVKSQQTRAIELRDLKAQEVDLKARYTDDYPDVVALRHKIEALQKEAANTPSATDGSDTSILPSAETIGIQQLRAQIRGQQQGIALKKENEAQVQAQIGLYQDRVRSSPEVQEQFKELTRDYDTAQKFYDDLLTKMNQSQMATDLERRQQGEQFRVVDQPNLPQQASFPKRIVFLTMGLAAGFGVGLLAIALAEYLDTSLRSERDVFAFTHLSTLAVIGHIEHNEPKRVRQTPSAFGAKLRNPGNSLADTGG